MATLNAITAGGERNTRTAPSNTAQRRPVRQYRSEANDLLVPQMGGMVAAVPIGLGSVPAAQMHKVWESAGVAGMTLRQFLYENFGWDIYEWKKDDIRF